MSTLVEFNHTLREYVHYDLLNAELEKRDYFFNKVQKDNSWNLGPLVIPFTAAKANSVRFGGLTPLNEINQAKHVKATLDHYREAWGSMKWNGSDLRIQNGKVSENAFLKNLPGQIEDFVDSMKESLSMNLLNGAHANILAADATGNDGIVTLKHIERLSLNQKLVLKKEISVSGGAASTRTVTVPVWVAAIDLNANQAVLVNRFNGNANQDAFNFAATPVLTGETTEDNWSLSAGAKIYFDGQESGNGFTSIVEQLDSDNTTLFGRNKAEFPFLQSVNISGAGFNSNNLLSQLFDAMYRAKKIGRGNPTELLMSYKHLATIKKALEASSGAYRHVETKVSPYNYEEVTIGGVKGQMKCVAIAEKDDDTIIGVDWNSMKFHTLNGFKRETAPDGNEYYTNRAETGYEYIADIACYGEFVASKPLSNFLIKDIPDYSMDGDNLLTLTSRSANSLNSIDSSLENLSQNQIAQMITSLQQMAQTSTQPEAPEVEEPTPSAEDNVLNSALHEAAQDLGVE